jgi:hypothetical protein
MNGLKTCGTYVHSIVAKNIIGNILFLFYIKFKNNSIVTVGTKLNWYVVYIKSGIVTTNLRNLTKIVYLWKKMYRSLE